MMNKQLSWGRNTNHLFFSLLFLIAPIFLNSMDDQSYANLKQKDEYQLAPAVPESMRDTYTCEGRTWKEMMDAFANAPEDAQLIVDYLQNPKKNPMFRGAALFVGKPGTGKSTAALAIPHIVNWYFDFVPSTAILGTYRNQAKDRLEMHLNRAVSGKRKTIVIIDEINRLLENFDSSNYDTDAIASALWMFLDRHKRNPNFFLIGTMNRDDKIPDPLKSRMVRIEFPPLTDELKVKIFKDIISSNGMRLDDKCHDVLIEASITLLGDDVSPRDYENVQMKIARLLCLENKRKKSKGETNQIKPRHIREAVQYVKESYTKNKYGDIQLTEEEWRDFNAAQNKIIDIQLQCAQKIPITVGGTGSVSLTGPNVGSNINISRAPGLDLDEAIEILERELSPAQKSIYRKVMKRKDTDPLIERGFFDTLKQKFIRRIINVVDKGGAKGLTSLDKGIMKFIDLYRKSDNQDLTKNDKNFNKEIDNE